MAHLRWRTGVRVLVIAAACTVVFAAGPASRAPTETAVARSPDGYVAPGDFDGDGRMDFSVKYDTGEWTIDLAANGFGTWDRSFPGFGGAEYVAAPADYDGDQRTDLSTKPPWGDWLIDFATNRWGEWDAVYGGYGSAQPLPADYDGDRRADLAVRVFAVITSPDREPAASTAYWNIDYAANGFGAWDRIVPMIVGEATPVPADYDGDGRTDLADKDVSGVWRIDYAANGFGAWDVIRSGYGFSDATPVPADYDGDRRADLSVKSSAGGWYIDYAADGFGAWNLIVTGYGGTTALPVPADYDGDRRADLAVRRDDGVWFVDLAADGFGGWNGSWRHDDESLPAGALSNPTGRPIGGGEGYGDWVTGGVTVSTAAQLRDALATAAPGSVIYVPDAAVIDLDDLGEFGLPLPLREGVTLASGRGRNGSLGGLIHSEDRFARPVFEVLGPHVRVTGLRLRGPDTEIAPVGCGRNDATAIQMTPPAPVSWPVRIDNNELWGWPNSTVYTRNVEDVLVHHNHVHHNRREVKKIGCISYGLGYGVVTDIGHVLVEANLFDHNRHDIAASGWPGGRYDARYNLVLNGAVDHSFDVHGGADRKDGTDIAGTLYRVHHNTFLQKRDPAFKIRGRPETGAYVWLNELRHLADLGAIVQTNASGNFHKWDNAFDVNRFPAWFVSFSGESYWRWRRFDGRAMSAVRFGDFDGDGRADAFAASDGEWIVSDGARLDWRSINTSSVSFGSLRFGDFDADGRTDVFRKSGSGWFVSWGGTSGWAKINTLPGALSALAFADFDADGRTDVFYADGARWRVSSGATGPWVEINVSALTTSSLRFADFNGDGRTDVFRADGARWYVSWGGTGPWVTLNTSSLLVGALAFGDFDGDGWADVFYGNGSTWAVSWGGVSAWEVINTSSIKTGSLAFADVNGDGRTDVVSRQSP